MKKSAKRLTLHRETLRHLEGSHLNRIAGGIDTSSACELATGCDCETYQDCYPASACFGTCSCSGTLNRTC